MNVDNYIYAQSIVSASSYWKCQILIGFSAKMWLNLYSPNIFSYFHTWWNAIL